MTHKRFLMLHNIGQWIAQAVGSNLIRTDLVESHSIGIPLDHIGNVLHESASLDESPRLPQKAFRPLSGYLPSRAHRLKLLSR